MASTEYASDQLVPLKSCTKCGATKFLDEFPRQKRNRDGRDSRCNACAAKHRLRHYYATTTKTRYVRTYMPQVEGMLPCATCKEYKPLAEFSRRRRAKTGYESYCKSCLREYVRSRPERTSAYGKRRKALKKGARIGVVTAPLLAAKMAYWGGFCWMCGDPATTWDHVKPLAKGGPHCLSNLRPACSSCNCSKRATWPIDTRVANTSALPWVYRKTS